ncbi:Protein kinase protein rad53 [Exophiala xenobiotica]|uniref:Protein kinase protein rad53 n=1 Tax=Lithohypha guttulata TaxID=1690604 RepID=A0ABR0K301_9EURO|nr:Protein kinase protein rad53 [Lithohypha guttulata]KAK5312474.1 Protein kinase protein rad53 [Exophiala xenobiotica]
MSAGLIPFLELTYDTETRDDLVDHFHLNAVQEQDGAVRHVNDGSSELWRREGRPIGTGGFGTAWLEREAGGKTRVVKEVTKVIPRVKTRYWVRELSTMALLSKNKTCYPEFYGWFQDESYVYIAMEHFPLGDLQAYVSSRLPQDQASLVVAQTCTALEVMHRKRITHRDLKPTNILVRQPPPKWQVVVCDFGISKRVRGATTALHTSFEGDFMAPEILGFVDDGTSGEYTSAVDMWSLGCLAYWLLKLKLPVPRRKMMAHCSRPWPDAAKSVETTDINEASTDFILSLLKPEPKQRPTASAAFAHDWLQGVSRGAPVSEPKSQSEAERNVTYRKLCDEEVHKGAETSQTLQKQSDFADRVSEDALPVVLTAVREREPVFTQFLSAVNAPYTGSSRSPNRSNLISPAPKEDDLPTNIPPPSSEERNKVANTGMPRVMRVVSHNIRRSPIQRSGLVPEISKNQQAAKLSKVNWASSYPITHSQPSATEGLPTVTSAEIYKRQMANRTKPTDSGKQYAQHKQEELHSADDDSYGNVQRQSGTSNPGYHHDPDDRSEERGSSMHNNIDLPRHHNVSEDEEGDVGVPLDKTSSDEYAVVSDATASESRSYGQYEPDAGGFQEKEPEVHPYQEASRTQRRSSQSFETSSESSSHRESFRRMVHDRHKMTANVDSAQDLSINPEDLANQSARLNGEQPRREEKKLQEIEVKVQRGLNEKRQELLARESQLREIEARNSDVNFENPRIPPAFPVHTPSERIKFGNVRCKDNIWSTWTKKQLVLEKGMLEISTAPYCMLERVVFLDSEVRVDKLLWGNFGLRFNIVAEFDGSFTTTKWKVGSSNMYCEAGSQTEVSDWIQAIKDARAATTWELDDCKERARRTGKAFFQGYEKR